MKFLVDPDFRTGFTTGVILHVIFVFTRINFLLFECSRKGCTEILYYDFPVSILYLAFDDLIIIFFSLFVGSALWGIWAFFLLKGVRLLSARIAR